MRWCSGWIVVQAQLDELAQPQPGRVEEHEDAAVFKIIHRPQQVDDLAFGQHLRQMVS